MRYLYYFFLASAIISSLTALLLLLVNDRYMYVPMIVAPLMYIGSRYTRKKLAER
jgi:hypothetical protein